MYVKHWMGCVLNEWEDKQLQKGRLDTFQPVKVTVSINWKNWVTIIDERTCDDFPCRERNGKIYSRREIPVPSPQLHLFSRCTIQPMLAIQAGFATKDGENGADY